MKRKHPADTEALIVHEFLEGPLTFIDAARPLSASGTRAPAQYLDSGDKP